MPEKFQPIPFFQDPTKSSAELARKKKNHDKMNLKLREKAMVEAEELERARIEERRKAQEEAKKDTPEAELTRDEKEVMQIYEHFGLSMDDFDDVATTPDGTKKDLSRLSAIERIEYAKKLKAQSTRMTGGNLQNKERTKVSNSAPLPPAGNDPLRFRHSSVIKASKIIEAGQNTTINETTQEAPRKEKNAKQDIISTEEERAHKALDKFFDNKEFLREIFGEEEVKIYHSEKKPGILFQFKDGEKVVNLIGDIKVISQDEFSADRVRLFKEKVLLALDDKKEKNTPISINIIVIKEDISELAERDGKGEIINTFAETTRNDIETQLALITLKKLANLLKEKGEAGRDKEKIDDYFNKHEQMFISMLTYNKYDFSGAVEELDSYLDENFPEIKNDPIIKNVLLIMGRIRETNNEEEEEKKMV